MFGGIRARLLGSYVLLLVVTLAVMAGALIFILSASPATNQRQVTQQLVRFIADELRTYLQASQRRPSVEGWLTAMADADPDIRVITINDRTNAVVTDSASQFQPGTVLQLQGTPIRDANPMPGNMPFMGNGDAVRLTEGAFSQDGSLWLFVRLNADRGRLGWLGRSVIVATEPPTLSLLQAIDQFQENLGAALVQAALVGGLIAVLLAVLITRTIARPLQTVAQAAAAVAEGDYSQRVPQRGPSEVRELAGAFNRMSKQVQLNNQAQQDWLANISHDLKTPLTSIRGYSQAIQDGTAPDPSRAAAIIYGESERLTRLVSQLTELARLRAGQLTPKQDQLDLGAMVDAMAQNLTVVAEQKDITLHTHIEQTPTLTGDGDQLAQVVHNLLSNALKYTPAGGQVTASVSSNGRGVWLKVQDTGIGIPPEDQARVFERFYQVDKARGHGHGLGLAITQEIVTAHGGNITVDSPGPGQGSTFRVWLPVDN